MKNSADIIIIGGGLAGLTLAIQLAAAKRSVMVFEKNKYPFHRVCGEYISMESWNFLERIGLSLNEFKLPRITALQVSSLTGNLLTHALSPGGFGISRHLLDYSLAELAKETGALVIDETRVDEIVNLEDSFAVTAGQEKFTAKLVIGAFGKRSNIDKKLERPHLTLPAAAQNWVGVKYHIKSALAPHIIQLHNFEGGYCGISKVEGDHYCLCYLTKAENLKRHGGSIRKMEEQLLSTNPYLKNIFADRPAFLFEDPVTISQINFENKLPVEKNMLMVGDAAGLIAPLCGNGMSMAMHASLISFTIIEKFLAGKISRAGMEKEYAAAWKKEFSLRLKAGRVLQPLLVKSALSKPSIGLLRHFPFVVKQIVKATHGKSFYF